MQPPARQIPPAPAHPAAPVPAPVSKSAAIFQQGSHEVDPHTGSSPPARDGRRGARAWASVAVLSRRLSDLTSLHGIVASGPCRKLATGSVIAPLAVLSAGSALALGLAEASGLQVDFDIYRMGAGHLFGSQLYAIRLSRALMGGSVGMHFTYPPFAAFLLVPFAMLPVRLGQLVWSVLNLGALFGLTAVSVHAVKPGWSRATASTLAALTLLPVLRLNPDLLTVDLGQINFVVVLLVFTDLTTVLHVGNRVIPRGVLVGVAAAVKLTPLLFVPFLLLARQSRPAFTALGSFLLCTLTAFVVAPYSSRAYWSEEIFDYGRYGNLLYLSDQNLHSAAERMLGGPPGPLLISSLTVVAACGGLGLAAWAYRASSPVLGILLCATTALIISPVSWVHHYVWVVPVLAWLLFGDDRPNGGRWWALGAAALFWAAPVWWPSDVQSGYGGPLVLLTGNSFFLAASAFLVLTAVLLIFRHRSRPRPA